MAITFVAAGTLASGDDSASLQPGLPAGIQTDDLLFLVAGDAGGATIDEPAGDYIVEERSGATGAGQIYVARRTVVGGESAPTLTFTGGNAAGAGARILAFRGVDATAPALTQGVLNRSANVDIVVPTVTPTADGSAIVLVGMKQAGWTSVGTASGDGLTWVEAFDHNIASVNDDLGLVVDYAIQITAATISAKTLTVTGGTFDAVTGVAFVLPPAVVVEPPATGLVKVKVSGTFGQKPNKRRVAGSFTIKPVKRVAGAFPEPIAVNGAPLRIVWNLDATSAVNGAPLYLKWDMSAEIPYVPVNGAPLRLVWDTNAQALPTPVNAAALRLKWDLQVPTEPPPPGTGLSANELMLWGGGGAGVPGEIITQTDATLDKLAAHGFKWVLVGVGYLGGFGGGGSEAAPSVRFRGDGGSTAAPEYRVQRDIENSNIVDRCHARGLNVYLKFSGAKGTQPTPHAIADWWVDTPWTHYAARHAELAAFGLHEGFDGIAVDYEVFNTDNSDPWAWMRGTTPYTATAHTELAIRDKCADRGEQVMTAIVANWPQVNFLVYNMFTPYGWQTTAANMIRVGKGLAAKAQKGEVDLQWNFAAGMTRENAGYSRMTNISAIFQKTWHQGNAPTDALNWENMLRYETNNQLTRCSHDQTSNNGLSAGFERWDTAHRKWFHTPFAWLDEPPPGSPAYGAYSDKHTPAYVNTQLQQFRAWGMGRMLPIFDFSGFDFDSSFNGTSWNPATQQQESGFDYRPALNAAKVEGVVDTDAPTLEVTNVGATTITGTANDTQGIRAVRWQDNLTRRGVCRMDYVIVDTGSSRPADFPELWIQDQRFDWTMQRSALSAGATSVTFEAEDLHGRTTLRVQQL